MVWRFEFVPGPAFRCGRRLGRGRGPVAGCRLVIRQDIREHRIREHRIREHRIREHRTRAQVHRVVHPRLAEFGHLIARHYYLVHTPVDLPVAKPLRAVTVVPEVGDVQPVPDFLEHETGLGSVPADGPRFPDRVEFLAADPLVPVASRRLEAGLF